MDIHLLNNNGTGVWGILVEELLKAGKKWKLLFIFVEADSIYSCKELKKSM